MGIGRIRVPRGIGHAIMRSNRQRKEQEARTLLGQIQKDETISEITRGELTGELEGIISGLGGVEQAGHRSVGEMNRAIAEFSSRSQGLATTLSKAREGQGIFGGRQQQKARASALADRPGRAQTILTR